MLKENNAHDGLPESIIKKDELLGNPVVFAEHHFDLATRMKSAKEYAKADNYYLQAIGMYRQIQEERPDLRSDANERRILEIINCRAQLLILQRRYEEAEPLLRQCIQGYRQMELAGAHVVRSLALVLVSMKKSYAEAAELYRKCITVFMKLAENEPAVYEPWVADVEAGLAKAYAAQGQNQSAAEEYKKALALYRKLAEKFPVQYDSFVVTICMELIKIALQEGSDIEEAKAYREEALEICGKYENMGIQAFALRFFQ